VNGKVVQRSEFTESIQHNAKRVYANGPLYKERQALVEHPFGTIKRQWGFDHIMTKKGIKAASADLGLIAIAYNLRRMFNLKTIKAPLHKALKRYIAVLKTEILALFPIFKLKILLYDNSLSIFHFKLFLKL